MNLERSSQFHQVRRILKTVAPDFRILANPGLAPGFSILDLQKKTIEVPEEGDSIEETVSCLLFQVGHAVWHRYNGIDADGSTDHLAKQNVIIDQFASDWAIRAMASLFSFRFNEAQQRITRLVWSYEDWVSYFSEK